MTSVAAQIAQLKRRLPPRPPTRPAPMSVDELLWSGPTYLTLDEMREASATLRALREAGVSPENYDADVSYVRLYEKLRRAIIERAEAAGDHSVKVKMDQMRNERKQ